MLLRRTLIFAMVLIGGLSLAGGSAAQTGAEPSAFPQLACLEAAPASQLSPPALADPASPLAFLANPGDERAAAKAAKKCAKDADCTLHDDYCNGCNCLALLVGTKPPKCNGTIVQCLVAPCQGKHAACQNGACVVVTGTTP